jgi:WD40 repeat protein
MRASHCGQLLQRCIIGFARSWTRALDRDKHDSWGLVMVRCDRRLPARSMGLAVTALVVACSQEPGAPPPACTSRPPLQLGTTVTPLNEVLPSSELLWVLSRNEIWYTSYSVSHPSALKAVDLASTAVRVVDGRNTTYHSPTLSPDGQSVYYLASPDPTSGDEAIYRVAVGGGSPELQVDSVRGFLVSPDGGHLAYGAGIGDDSVFLLDAVTKARTFVIRGGPNGPVAFSPDGLRLLVRQCNGSPCSYLAVTLASGATEPVSLGTPILVRWDPDGLRVLSTDSIVVPDRGLYVRNVTTGTTARIASMCGFDVPGEWSWALSPDGRRVAHWTQSLSITPPSPPSSLHLANAQADDVLEVVNGDGGTVAFAPDGGRIAYVGAYASAYAVFVSPLP